MSLQLQKKQSKTLVWNQSPAQSAAGQTPCVVTVLATANKARYMSVRGIVEAYNKEVEVWGFEHISVEGMDTAVSVIKEIVKITAE